jgi:hypothetical protein
MNEERREKEREWITNCGRREEISELRLSSGEGLGGFGRLGLFTRSTSLRSAWLDREGRVSVRVLEV